MNQLNRVAIFLMLLTVLYGLYLYKNKISSAKSENTKRAKLIGPKNKNFSDNKQELDSSDASELSDLTGVSDLSLSGISQLSLSSSFSSDSSV